MSKEYYLSQPPAVEVHPVRSGTDIILRMNISETTIEPTEEGGKPENVYVCDEAQYRYSGKLTAEDVTEHFEYWWEIANGRDEVEAADTEATEHGMPTVTERLDALEGALMELAEVIING